ncbi:MAG: hypothetical protein R8M14_03435 [Ghiorsea sp.]
MPIPLSFLSVEHQSEAWLWLCKQRRDFPSFDEVWFLRFYKTKCLSRIFHQIYHHRYTFSPAQRIIKKDGSAWVVWSASDALVQKLLCIYLQDKLPIHQTCTHIKGHGGHKFSIRSVKQWFGSGEYSFVCRTDIKAMMPTSINTNSWRSWQPIFITSSFSIF